MTARGASNALTRTTAILAAAFFATSLTLTIIARYGEQPIDILDRVPAPSPSQPAPPTGGGVLDQLGGPGAQPAPATAPPSENGGAVPIAPLAPVAPSVPNQ
jgi:preprotein translocase subunit SecG